jgi:hypothetical protein
VEADVYLEGPTRLGSFHITLRRNFKAFLIDLDQEIWLERWKV